MNIPPYICELAKSIAILEGVALQVDPNYKIVMEAYPFVTRRLFKDSGDSAQVLLRETLYDEEGRIRPQRLSILLNKALNVVNKSTDSFIDLDTPPEENAPLEDIIKYLFSGRADSILNSLKKETVESGDLVLRETVRRVYKAIEK